MENTLIILVSILGFLVLGLTAIVAVFLFNYLKLKRQPRTENQSSSNHAPEIMEAIEAAKISKQQMVSQFCIDHPELYAKGICSISNDPYCELCITKENEVKVARKYLDLFLDSEWDDIFMLNNELTGADKLNELVKTKKELWTNEEIPIITQKQFKINIENDRIEAYTMLKGRLVDQEIIKEKFKFLNK